MKNECVNSQNLQNEYVTAKTYSDAGLSGSGEDANHAVAPMPGIIEKILVQKGQQVNILGGYIFFETSIRIFLNTHFIVSIKHHHF